MYTSLVVYFIVKEQFNVAIMFHNVTLYRAGIATGYGLHYQGVGVRVSAGARIFASSCRLDRLWAPLSVLANGYGGGSFPGDNAAGE
jgi:hypothetical protein